MFLKVKMFFISESSEIGFVVKTQRHRASLRLEKVRRSAPLNGCIRLVAATYPSGRSPVRPTSLKAASAASRKYIPKS